MCARVHVCVAYCCLGSPCSFKSSGCGGGGGECKVGGGLGSPWFPLLPPEGAAQVPSWRWMARPEGGMLRPLASHSLCGDRCSCRGPVPLHRPNITPISSPASSHQVSAPTVHRGDREVSLEICQWWGTSEEWGPEPSLPSLSLVSS